VPDGTNTGAGTREHADLPGSIDRMITLPAAAGPSLLESILAEHTGRTKDETCDGPGHDEALTVAEAVGQGLVGTVPTSRKSTAP
jgi:hypothetical protein